MPVAGTGFIRIIQSDRIADTDILAEHDARGLKKEIDKGVYVENASVYAENVKPNVYRWRHMKNTRRYHYDQRLFDGDVLRLQGLLHHCHHAS